MFLKILHKRWWSFTLIAAISGALLSAIYYLIPVVLRENAPYFDYALIAAYLVGVGSTLMGQIVTHKRPGNVRVYKITRREGDIEECEEITPI